MSDVTFQEFPKIPRLFRDVVITEKIDGTNAAVIVDYEVAAQSRKRLITPEDDNHGFAAWVHEHSEKLAVTLGPGRHFGEWWGAGIQRGYGLQKGDKRFSLFNTKRWGDVDLSWVPGLGVVPVLYQGRFRDTTVESVLDGLRMVGSHAAPGFMRPEGVVVYHTAANSMFKVTLEGDDQPKGAAA